MSQHNFSSPPRNYRAIRAVKSWLLIISLLAGIFPLPLLAQKNRTSSNPAGTTPPPVIVRHQTSAVAPLPPVTAPPVNNTPVPPASRNAAKSLNGRITQSPNLPCADCEPVGGGPANDTRMASGRVRPQNAVGEEGVMLGSRNFHWSANLLNLPGRAGMDVNLSLAYN